MTHVMWLACLVILVASGCSVAVSEPPESLASDPSGTSLPATPSTSATPRDPHSALFGPEALAHIVVSAETVPAGMTIDDELSGRKALEQPVLLLEQHSLLDQAGFVDARMTRLGTSGPGSYWEEGGYVTWAALYGSAAAAETALGALLNDHEAPTGWGMQRVDRAPYGVHGVSLEGPAYGFDALVHVWRVDNLLLAAVALGAGVSGDDAVAQLWSIVDGMDGRMPAPANR
jgi:hypothetical protein